MLVENGNCFEILVNLITELFNYIIMQWSEDFIESFEFRM